MSGVDAVGAAEAQMADGTIDSETTTASGIFILIGCAVPLNEDWSKQLAYDQAIDFKDNLLIATDARYAAVAAADYAQYTMDSSAMDRETGYQNTIMQNEKTEARTLGNAMDNVYKLAEPVTQEQKATSHAILSFASMNQ
jgi:hypothetical protein